MVGFLFLTACLFPAVAPIALAIGIRSSVKNARQRIIKDLDKYFRLNSRPGAVRSLDEDLLHSFEFVKFKYHLDGEERPEGAVDFTPLEWVFSALPLVALLVAADAVASTAVLISAGCKASTIPFAPSCLVDFLCGHLQLSFALLAAYLGAYTYMIRSFFQAINNFDLMPASFFGAMNNVIFGIALPPVVFAFATGTDSHVPSAVVVVTFFALGYMPDAALRFILQTSVVKTFKGERVVDGDKTRSVSMELLDGIDSLVRFRLSDFHLSTVQNLASANPIMLFVETPFGIYQMVDWVAQAQLCASVGVDRLYNLWDLGIRTVLDLERAVLHETDYVDDNLLYAIETVLFTEKTTTRPGLAPARNLVAGKPLDWKPDALKANVRMRIDTPYTQRLRQIVNCISDQLGVENRSLTRYPLGPS